MQCGMISEWYAVQTTIQLRLRVVILRGVTGEGHVSLTLLIWNHDIYNHPLWPVPSTSIAVAVAMGWISSFFLVMHRRRAQSEYLAGHCLYFIFFCTARCPNFSGANTFLSFMSASQFFSPQNVCLKIRRRIRRSLEYKSALYSWCKIKLNNHRDYSWKLQFALPKAFSNP